MAHSPGSLDPLLPSGRGRGWGRATYTYSVLHARTPLSRGLWEGVGPLPLLFSSAPAPSGSSHGQGPGLPILESTMAGAS